MVPAFLLARGNRQYGGLLKTLKHRRVDAHPRRLLVRVKFSECTGILGVGSLRNTRRSGAKGSAGKWRLASISVGQDRRSEGEGISRERPSTRISNFSFHATEWDSSLFLRAPARARGSAFRIDLLPVAERKAPANTDKSFFLTLARSVREAAPPLRATL